MSNSGFYTGLHRDPSPTTTRLDSCWLNCWPAVAVAARRLTVSANYSVNSSFKHTSTHQVYACSKLRCEDSAERRFAPKRHSSLVWLRFSSVLCSSSQFLLQVTLCHVLARSRKQTHSALLWTRVYIATTLAGHVSLGRVFGYNSPKSEPIWTKLGT